MADAEVDSEIDFGIFGRYIRNNSAQGGLFRIYYIHSKTRCYSFQDIVDEQSSLDEKVILFTRC